MDMHRDPFERKRQADVALSAVDEVRANILDLVHAGYIPLVSIEKLYDCFRTVQTKYQDVRSEAWDEIENEMAATSARFQIETPVTIEVSIGEQVTA